LVDPKVTVPARITDSHELGFMLYDLDFTDPADIKPMFFRAKLDNGVIAVPDRDSPEVRR